MLRKDARFMKLQFEQFLPLDIESVFRHHETPANLVRLMEGWPAFRMVEHEGRIDCGAKVHVAERVGPFWVRMTFEHFIYEPPYRFAERQIKGPFRKCEHIHEFVEEAGGTKIIDHLEVELPMWLGGSLATRILVAPKLQQMFAFRKKAYLSLHNGGKISTIGKP